MRLLILAAVLPALLLIVYVYHKDGIEKEPTGLLVRLFLAGCLCCIPASVLESIFLGIAEGFFMDTALAFIEAFLVVAVAEEGCKLIALRLISWKNPAFNYTFDGIVYAVCVSLGFAALENVMYLSSYGLNLAVPRGLLSVPGHAAFAVFMGVFYANAKRCAARGDAAAASRSMRLAFVVPVLLHGFFDFCLMSGSEALGLVFFGFVIAVDILTLRVIRRSSKADSPIDPPALF